MKTSNVRSIQYKDKFAARRERRKFLLWMLGGLGVLGLLGGILYILFFAPTFAIRDVQLSGLEEVKESDIRTRIEETVEREQWGIFKVQKNILFFDAEGLREEFVTKFPVFQEVVVEKKYPHAVIYNFVEREPVGIWCRENTCRYFDRLGAQWGEAIRSSGSLLLPVEDQRRDRRSPDPVLLSVLTLQERFKIIGLTIKNLVITPEDQNEFRIAVADGYDILFDNNYPILDQVETLRVFLEQKRSGPTFLPQYLDLRIPGRVYFK